MQSYQKQFIYGLVLLAFVGFAGGMWYSVRDGDRTIPASITSDIPYTVYVPDEARYPIDKTTVKYDTDTRALTYEIPDGEKGRLPLLTVSLQAAPDQFADVPDYYTKVVDQMGQYASLDTSAGKVYLTQKVDKGGKQIAVFNNQGTLVFVQADSDLLDDEWRKLFNTMKKVE